MEDNSITRLIRDHINPLAEKIMARQYEIQPELLDIFDVIAKEKSIQDTRHNLAFLSRAIHYASSALFTDYIRWLQAVLESRGLNNDILLTNLEAMQEILIHELPPPEADSVISYLQESMKILQEPLRDEPVPYINPREPHGGTASAYIHAILNANRSLAREIIFEAISHGTSIRDIYLLVFKPVQYEIGRLWQINEISVAQEHYATAVTQQIMSQLYPYIFASNKNGRSMVATCVGDELHEMGIRMVTDLFEIAGWDTYYLGANTPNAGIIDMLIQQNVHLLAISSTMATHLDNVEKLISAVRASPAAKVKIIVGGYPFNLDSMLFGRVGADASAPDIDIAIRLSEQLLN